MLVVVIDSLFESLDVEREAAARYGARVVRLQDDPSLLARADVVAHVRTHVDAELIAAMSSCRVIARFGTGLDTVDLGAAERAGITVVGVRDYCVPELTSHTLALAFSLARRIRERRRAGGLGRRRRIRPAPRRALRRRRRARLGRNRRRVGTRGDGFRRPRGHEPPERRPDGGRKGGHARAGARGGGSRAASSCAQR